MSCLELPCSGACSPTGRDWKRYQAPWRSRNVDIAHYVGRSPLSIPTNVCISLSGWYFSVKDDTQV